MHDDKSIQEIAEAVTQLPLDERQQYLEQQSANDPALIKQINTLIAQQNQPYDDHQIAHLDLSSGDLIGPYEIIEELGHGGMGTVFLVEQKQPIQRKVALKVVRLGMDTQEVLQRFEQERQALAVMAHPNVAAVYDAGATDQGRPYFVMEYVPGDRITDYANSKRLNIHDRVKLMIQACKGVLHAHQKGILHRDLKPGNILVNEHDGHPMVKIIDFGVAKSIQQKASEQSVQTQVGAFVGTPYYMSPEQAIPGSADVDTRTDVYSLGVLLYELMVGSLPFDQQTFNNKTPQEVQQIIQSHEAPSPFHKLKSKTYDLQNIATLRHSSIHEIKRVLKGDLGSIIMQALAKDPELRYASVSALEADLTKYLAGLPVDAQTPSTRYRLGKFLKRHKLLVTALTGVVLSLTAGLLIALNALNRAERESVHAAAVSELLSGIILNADPENSDYRDQITLNEVITGLESKLDSDELLSGSAFDRAREMGLENSLQWTLYEHLADIHHSVGNFAAAKDNYLKAMQLRQGDDEDPLAQVKLKLKLSKTWVALGSLEQAEVLFNEAIEAVDPPQNEAQAAVLLAADGVFRSRGEIGKNIEFERRLLKVAEQFYGKQSGQYAWQLIELTANLIQTGQAEDIEEGLAMVRQAKSVAQNLTEADLTLEFNASRFIIYILNINDPEQAVQEGHAFFAWCQEVYGVDHLKTMNAGSLLTYLLLWSGQHLAALDLTNQLIPSLEKQVEPDHQIFRTINKYKGNALVFLNRYQEALPILMQELKLAELSESRPEIAYAAEAIAQSTYYLGDMVKAMESIEMALAHEGHVLNQSIILAHKAQFHLASGALDSAEQIATQALDHNPENAVALNILGHVAFKQENHQSALEQLQLAVTKQAAQTGESSLAHLTVLADYVLTLIKLEQTSNASDMMQSINVPIVESAQAAYVKLVALAAQHANGDLIDTSEIEPLVTLINQSWAPTTRQHQSAMEAVGIIR